MNAEQADGPRERATIGDVLDAIVAGVPTPWEETNPWEEGPDAVHEDSAYRRDYPWGATGWVIMEEQRWEVYPRRDGATASEWWDCDGMDLEEARDELMRRADLAAVLIAPAGVLFGVVEQLQGTGGGRG